MNKLMIDWMTDRSTNWLIWRHRWRHSHLLHCVIEENAVAEVGVGDRINA